MSLEPGSRLGPFEVLSRLGAGGMGEVWRARDTRLQRDVAIKVLPEAFAQDADRLQRFTREAHVLASLNHPNIAAIYSFEEIDGVRFLVLELVSGETLKQRIVRAPVSASEAIRFALQIADALDAAHAKGILHRDLKPANVNVTPEGKVKLLDFGLAKAFALGAASPEISHSPTLAVDPTHQGVVLGTASYMSPEQARGRALDARSDLWSFGCVLYEMLAGKKAFDGESVSDILVAILDREPDWAALPAATPTPLRDLMKRLLQKDPAGRPATIGDTRGFLEAAAGSRTTAIFPASGRSASAARRGGSRALLVAGSILLAVGAALFWLAMRERSGSALPASKLLAILPATDLTGRPDGRQLCDGVSFSLGVKLQGVPNLAIMPPSGPAMLKETDPAKWARDTGANLLVQPAVRQMGEERQLSFSLSLAGSPVQIEAGEVTGPAAEHFKLEEQLAQKLVAALKLQLSKGTATPSPASVPAGAPQTDYVVALGHLERYDDPASVQKAIDLLKTIPGNDGSALVQAALGRAYLYQYSLLKDRAIAEQARLAIEKAVQIDPRLPDVHVTLGQYWARTGRACDAIAELSRAGEQQPRSVTTVLALGEAQEDCGRLADAEATYRRGIDLNPAYWAGYNKLGLFYFTHRRSDEAEKVLRQAIARNPDVARVYNSLGAVLLQSGRLEEASKALRDSITRQIDNPSAWSNLGSVHYYSGRYGEAVDAFRRASRLTPKSGFLWANLGDALSMIPGREADARAAYEEGLRLGRETLAVNPKNARATRLLSRCYSRTGNLAEASRWLDEALKAEPANVENLLQRALLDHLKGDDEKAAASVRQLVAAGYSPTLIRNEPAFGSLLKTQSFEAALSKGSAAPVNSPTP